MNIEEMKDKKIYIEEIIKQLNDSNLISNKQQQEKIVTRLRKATLDEVERVYDAFHKFGAKEIFDVINIK